MYEEILWVCEVLQCTCNWYVRTLWCLTTCFSRVTCIFYNNRYGSLVMVGLSIRHVGPVLEFCSQSRKTFVLYDRSPVWDLWRTRPSCSPSNTPLRSAVWVADRRTDSAYSTRCAFIASRRKNLVWDWVEQRTQLSSRAWYYTDHWSSSSPSSSKLDIHLMYDHWANRAMCAWSHCIGRKTNHL